MKRHTISQAPLHSKRSFIATYILSLAFFIMGSAAVVSAFSGGADTTAWEILFILFGVMMVFVGFKTITLRIEVARDGMMVHQLWKEIWIPWEAVTKIAVAPTYADSEHLNVCYDRKRVSLPIGFLKNPQGLNKAIIEAATSVNKEIELSPLTVKLYGPPPYGVFSNREADL